MSEMHGLQSSAAAAAAAIPDEERRPLLRPSSLTTVNKVSNIPFDRTPIALAEGGREKSPERLFLLPAMFFRAALKALTCRNVSLLLKEKRGRNQKKLERKSQSGKIKDIFYIRNKIR